MTSSTAYKSLTAGMWPHFTYEKTEAQGGKQLGQGHTAAEVRDRNMVLSDADAINHKLSYQGQKIYGINSGSLKTNEPNCFKMTDKVAKLPSEVLMTKKLGEKSTQLLEIFHIHRNTWSWARLGIGK